MKKLLPFLMLIIASFSVSAQKYLFIGIDSRNPDRFESSNSDMIMIMDIRDADVKIASIMRDTYVSIPGKGHDKINAAFRYGGEDLLLQTIYSNFHIPLKNYIIVDFNNAPEAIDTLGGVVVNVDNIELKQINKYIYEQNLTNKHKYLPLNKTGDVLLNGGQTLAYCRIRIDGDGDRTRTGRQQEVLTNLIKKVNESFKITNFLTTDRETMRKEYNKLLSLYKFFRTDLPISAFIELGQKFLQKKLVDETITIRPQSKTFPITGYNKRLNGVIYYMTDIDKMAKDLNYYLNTNPHGKYN